MKYFVFRNNTIEPFFSGAEYSFSGYDDLSQIPEDFDWFIWFYQLPVRYDIGALAEEVCSYIEKMRYVVSRIQTDKTILLFTIHNVCAVSLAGNDVRLEDAVQNYNAAIAELSRTKGNVKRVDYATFVKDYSVRELVDWKFYFMSQVPMNPRLAKPFKSWFDSQLKQIMLKRKKCLVLDLDNTLWGGVLGEDGIDGIKVGGDYPGKAYLYFQEALLELEKTGIILTVCSKNNEQDVLDVWEKNPFLVLRKEHFSAYRINWKDKASNIRELAAELNIGLDSFVFVDDNPTERELIKQVLPMVSVPEFPKQAYELPQFFEELVCNYFLVYSVTDEDRNKTEQYKANALRTHAQNSFSDFGQFLYSLEMCLTIEKANEFNLPRIAQMTQKTNQFNLTTRRYTDADIRQKMHEGAKVWCVSVADKFGDSGITGCLIVEKGTIDTFLLSCRVLGKGIEKAFLYMILNELYEAGEKCIEAAYLPTAKNMQVSEFYDRCGFILQKTDADGARHYKLEITNYFEIESYYKIIMK